jgi:hypothetical protein
MHQNTEQSIVYNINYMGEKGKLESLLESRYFVALIIALVAIIAFCLGRISKLREVREPVRVLNSGQPAAAAEAVNATNNNQTNSGNNTQVIGSKSGTKYHLPTCPGAKQISEKNKITFSSIEEARAKGYTPATNCKGLK